MFLQSRVHNEGSWEKVAATQKVKHHPSFWPWALCFPPICLPEAFYSGNKITFQASVLIFNAIFQDNWIFKILLLKYTKAYHENIQNCNIQNQRFQNIETDWAQKKWCGNGVGYYESILFKTKNISGYKSM